MIPVAQKTEILTLDSIGIAQKVIAEMLGVAISTVNRTINDVTRALLISDLHCGHKSGLTPPKWQNTVQQEEVWEWYSKRVKQLKPDVVFVLGDCMDGKGKRSGGTELIEQTWLGQIDMAAECIKEIECDNVHMVYGTPYHTGDDEDYEAMLASNIKATIKSHAWPRIHGITFDLKHKVGGSSIPHGRSSALKKSKMWNAMWADRKDGQPKADVLVRGHVHYHDFTGTNRYLAMTMPALQGWGSKYGERQCEGEVDTGLVWFDIRPGDTLQTLKWQADIPFFQSHIAHAYDVVSH
jgi:hypothetical protein